MSNKCTANRLGLRLALTFAGLLILLGLTLPQAALAQAPNFVVYDDALENGGQNWSWATTSLTNTSPVHSGNDSISVNAGPNQALYIHENPFTTSPYVSLNFYIDGGASGGQKLQVQATISGTAQTAVPIAPLAANTWTLVSIPLSSLGVANTSNVDGFWIQDTTGTTQPVFYVDDISFISTNAPPPPATVTIDAAANNHPISPLVYGVAFASTSQLEDMNAPFNRSGGNNETRYNWQINAINLDNDWYFESVPGSDGSAPGADQDSFFSSTKTAGAQAAMTVPMLGWVANLGSGRQRLDSFSVAKYGAQQATDPFWSDAGNGILPNGSFVTNNPNDADVTSNVANETGWIDHMISTWGTSAKGGLSYYLMDNEPSIWFSTHRDVHPNGPSMDEIYNDIVGYGGAVKAADPNALVLGPEEWGWSAYFYSGEDQQYGSIHGWNGPLPDRTAHNNMDYVPWLLQQLQQYQTTNGTRLLDYLSLHFYPQANEFSSDDSAGMDLLRNRSTRQLWDPNYTSESWISTPVYLIPRMKAWVNQYYPGTKVAITEYNWGDEDAMNGATTQADIFGIFGQQGLDLGTRWTVPDPSGPCYQTFKMYRNYDGKKSTFGDTSVSDSVPNPDNLSSFAAVRSSDGALTIMVINKWLSGPNTPVTVNIANFNGGSTAQVWQLSSASSSITQLASLPVVSNSISLSAPPESVTLLIVPATTGTAPAAPTGLTATGGNAQVNLSWTASTGATSYNVYRSTTSGAETLLQSGVTTTSFTDSTVTNGTTYYYEVTAVNANGESGKSNEASATPQVPAPAAPTGLTATGGNAQVVLSWTASTGATSYNVYRATTSGAETLLQSGVTTTSFTDSGVTNGTTYFYEVTAVNAGGESGKSNEASATPQVAVPSAPTNLTATGGNKQVALSWTASTGAVTYNVYRSTTSGSETLYQSGVVTTSFTDTTVTNGTTYYYEVTAVNPGGESAKSKEASTTPLAPATAVFVKQDTTTSGNWKGVYGSDGFNIFTDTSANNPTMPAYATVTPTGNSVFQWAAPATNNPTYALQQAAAGSMNRLAGVWYSPSSFSLDMNLTDGNTHQVALYLLAWQNSTLVETVTITDAVNGNTLDTRSVSSLSNGDYEVYNISGHVKITITVTSGKNGVISAFFFDPKPAPPAVPIGLTATPGNAQVTLNWSASAGATSYNVYRSTTSGGEGGTPIKTGVTTASFTDSTVTNGTTYYYEVTAVNVNGESGKSNEASTTPQVQKPAAPTGLTATPGNNQVALNWTASAGATSYNVYRATTSGSETLYQSGVATTTFTDTTVTNGTTYFYEVTALNAGGESGKSNEASATPQLLAPTKLTATPGNAQVVLNWTASAGATAYNVYRATTSGAETLYQTNVATTTYTDTSVMNGTTYFYEVTALGSGAQSGKSNEASATPTAVTAKAVFIKQDTTTSGNWKGVYGSDGFNIFTDTSANNPTMPAYATVTPTGNSVFQWAAPATNNPTYALQQTAAGSMNRLAGVWYSPTSFSLDMNLTDGNTHQVALYLLAWQNSTLVETVTITDAVNGNTLDTRSVSSLSNGDYEVYNISGHVKITITVTTGKNGVISAFFFDPKPPPPPAPTGLTATAGNAQVTLNWTASTGATSYNVYRSTTSGGEGTTPIKTGVTTTSYTDTGLTNGTTYYYEVTAANANGEGAKSNEASTTPSAANASVVFVKQDTTTSGNWKGVYGSDGFNIFTDTSANNPTMPAYATVTPTGNSVFQWAAPATNNPTHALQQAAAGSMNRLAGVWYSPTSFSLDMNLTDGNTHQVALYLLAWQNSTLVETVTITDAVNGNTLDTRSVSSLSNGDYEVYNISGHVKITITVTTGKNGVISAFFFK